MDDPPQFFSRLGHQVDIRAHSGAHPLEVCFPEIGQDVPDLPVDQREDLFTHGGISTGCDLKVGHIAVACGVDLAVGKLQLGIPQRRLRGNPAHIHITLFPEKIPCPFECRLVLGDLVGGGDRLGLGELVFIDRHVEIADKGLHPLRVVDGVGRLGLALLELGLRCGDLVLVGLDLKLGKGQLRLGLLRFRRIGTRIEFEKQIPPADKLIVLHMDGRDRATHLRGDSDHVGPHLGVLGAGIGPDVRVNLHRQHSGRQKGGNRDQEPENPPERLLRTSGGDFRGGVRGDDGILAHLTAKKRSQRIQVSEVIKAP